MPGIEAGLLKERVTLLKPVITHDEYGQQKWDFLKVGPVWAQVVGGGGGTSVAVNHVSITYNHTVRVRYCSAMAGVDATWKIEFRDRILEISSVPPLMSQESVIEFECQEELPAAIKPDFATDAPP